MKKDRKYERGFTLIEIMIVLAIMGLIFSFVGVNLIGRLKESKGQAAKIQIANFQQALQAYYLDSGMYPNTAQGLHALVQKPSAGRVPDKYPQEGYLRNKNLPKDPWNRDYRYECEDYQNYAIISNGPDGEPNTEDDIKSE